MSQRFFKMDTLGAAEYRASESEAVVEQFRGDVPMACGAVTAREVCVNKSSNLPNRALP
jgi:hypothetical protein